MPSSFPRLPRPSLSVAITALVFASALPLADVDAQTERRTLDGSSVAVYNLAGRITVEPGSGSDVVVEVMRGGRDANRLRIETGELRGRNTLRVIYPTGDDIIYADSRSRGSSAEFTVNDDGTWDGGGWNRGRRGVRVKSSGSGTEAWADIRILVPRGRTLDVNLGVGRIDANRVDADLTLDVAAASVFTTGTRGRLNIDAGSGGIDVRDADGESLTIDTGSGGVTLSGITSAVCDVDTGSGGVTGDRLSCDEVKMDAGSGSIRLTDVRSSRASVETGSGGVRLDLRSVPRSLSVEAGSGSVVVGLPDNAGAEVDIDTGSGGIQTDFPLQTNRYERNHLRGRIGNGSARITISTGSGSVSLRRN